MKKNLILLSALLMLCFAFPTAAQTDGTVSFSVRTVTNHDVYSPENILAIWLESPGGIFVRTFKVRAANRIAHLYTWKLISGMNTTDAITGATLSNHTTHSITWNCRNLSNQLMADGEYRIRVEFTEAHNQGPVANYVFTKGATSETINYPDQTYFKDAVLTYTVLTDIQDEQGIKLSVYPNPFEDVVIFAVAGTSNAGQLTLEVYDSLGNLVVRTLEFAESNNMKMYRWSLLKGQSNLAPGTYFYRMFSSDSEVSGKILKLR